MYRKLFFTFLLAGNLKYAFHDVAFRLSVASLTSYFLKIVVKVKPSGQSHVLTIVAWVN